MLRIVSVLQVNINHAIILLTLDMRLLINFLIKLAHMAYRSQMFSSYKEKAFRLGLSFDLAGVRRHSTYVR